MTSLCQFIKPFYFGKLQLILKFIILRALGCILFEIFTGQPPFYTNNLYHLVDMIIKRKKI